MQHLGGLYKSLFVNAQVAEDAKAHFWVQEAKPQTECCLLARLSRAQASEGKKFVITQLCWGVKGRRLYSVLELARYGSLDKLRQLVDSGASLAYLLYSVAVALTWLHGQGVIHCDLKPANILLGADLCPLLADFNLSLDLTATGGRSKVWPAGTPGYQAPEVTEKRVLPR